MESHPGGAPSRDNAWHKSEELLLTLFFGVTLCLPLLDILGRQFSPPILIPGSLTLVQHLTLVVMMFGGALAAREGKLLALATTAGMVPDRFKPAARVATLGLGAAFTFYLALASWQYAGLEREWGHFIAGWIPKWIVVFSMPLGFAAIAGRMIWRSSDSWKERLLTLGVSLALASLGPLFPAPPQAFIHFALVLLVIAILLGTPVFVALGGAALLLLWNSDTPIISIPAEAYRMVVSPTIPTIPLFTLTGYFLAEGGASQRLLRVFQALFGSMRGGPAIVTCLLCAFFTCLTGGSGVTILALGGLLMPILLAERYQQRHALGLLTSAGSLGMLFPPSIPVILYGVVAQVSILDLFIGGFVPGMLLLIATAWWGILKGSKEQAAKHPFTLKEAKDALWAAKWELLLPFVVIFFLLGVKVTLVESAALAALYAFVVEVFIYRDLKFARIPKVVMECGILVGGVLLILGVSLGFTNYMVDAQIPAQLTQWVRDSVHSKWVFLLLVNILLILVGSFLEIFAAIVVVVPLLIPMADAFGVDPVHLGIIFLANLELGFLAPPLGLNLFLSSYRFKKPMSEVYISVLPNYIILHLLVFAITYMPSLTTALPNGEWGKLAVDLGILLAAVLLLWALTRVVRSFRSSPSRP